MKEIKLTQGKVAIIDDEDFKLISKHKWCVSVRPCNNFYAVTRYKKRLIIMHIMLLGKKPGLDIDHINHNGLDNRRTNLRHVTRQQNMFNSRGYKKRTSIYKGVCQGKKNKKYGRWVSYIKHNGKTIYLGSFTDEVSAAKAYNNAAIEKFGKFACLNNLPARCASFTDISKRRDPGKNTPNLFGGEPL